MYYYIDTDGLRVEEFDQAEFVEIRSVLKNKFIRRWYTDIREEEHDTPTGV